MRPRHSKWVFLVVLLFFSSYDQIAGASEFVRTYGGTGIDVGLSIIQTADGGFVAAGGTASAGAGSSDLWIIRTDFDGDILWEKTYGGTGLEPVERISVRETANRHIVVAGATASFGGGGGYEGWMLLLDGTGQVVWERSFGGASIDLLFRPIEIDGGRFIATGATSSFGSGGVDAWVLWVDEYGQLTQEMAYGAHGDEIAIGSSMTSAGLILGGKTDSFGVGGEDGWVVLLHPETGQVVWSKSYGGTLNDSFMGVTGVKDGGFVVVGDTASFGAGGSDAWVMKLDGNGNPIWQKTYGGSGDERAFSVVEMDDGNLAVLGTTTSFGSGKGDAWLLVLDPSGNIVREHTYGGSEEEIALEISKTHDRGLVFAGSTGSFATGTADLWVLKVTGSGDVPDPICVHLFGSSTALVTPSTATVATAPISAVSDLSAGTVSATDTTAIIMSVGAGLTTTPLCFTPSPVFPSPQTSELIPYGPLPGASIGSDIFSTRPLGVGNVAGGILTLNVAIPYFDAPVDLFVGVSSPVLGGETFLIAEDGSLRGASTWLGRWRFETHGGYVTTLMGDVSVSAIPPGDYTFYVAATPPGGWASYYLWFTTLALP